jgi:hypothetical protein
LRGGRRKRRQTEKKAFFFEKKQKTFAPTLSYPGAKLIGFTRNQTGKSFLVLFFKKEHLSWSWRPSAKTPPA